MVALAEDISPPSLRPSERYYEALKRAPWVGRRSRTGHLPDGELVLLLTEVNGPPKRIVIRMVGGAASVQLEASASYLPQAVVRSELAAWMEFLTSERMDPERFELFGEPSVLTNFLRLQRRAQHPLDLRCATMSSRSGRHQKYVSNPKNRIAS